MDGMNFLVAKFNLNEKQNLIDVANHYADNKMFFEAFSYISHASYYHDLSDLYYKTLSRYLQSEGTSSNIDTPLLITWAISPKNVPFLHMSDSNVRLKENMAGLAAWILDKSFENIIVCDGTGFELDINALKRIGAKHNKNISYHSFVQSDGASKFGKGYGEGEIINFAFQENPKIRNSKRFTKMNGKQYIPFYEFSLLRGKDSYEYFNLHYIANRPAIDTRFYCVDVQYYLKNLQDSYKRVNDFNTNYLEHVFFEDSMNRTNFFLPKEPIVFGKQGSIDKNYGEYPDVVKDFAKHLIETIV
jgi:hypothetical protein